MLHSLCGPELVGFPAPRTFTIAMETVYSDWSSWDTSAVYQVVPLSRFTGVIPVTVASLVACHATTHNRIVRHINNWVLWTRLCGTNKHVRATIQCTLLHMYKSRVQSWGTCTIYMYMYMHVVSNIGTLQKQFQCLKVLPITTEIIMRLSKSA